MTARATIFDS